MNLPLILTLYSIGMLAFLVLQNSIFLALSWPLLLVAIAARVTGSLILLSYGVVFTVLSLIIYNGPTWLGSGITLPVLMLGSGCSYVVSFLWRVEALITLQYMRPKDAKDTTNNAA